MSFSSVPLQMTAFRSVSGGACGSVWRAWGGWARWARSAPLQGLLSPHRPGPCQHMLGTSSPREPLPASQACLLSLSAQQTKVCGIVFILYFMMPLFYQMSRKKGHVAAKPRRGGGQGIRHQALGADTPQLQGTLPLLSALATAGNTGMWAGGGGPGPGQSRTGV